MQIVKNSNYPQDSNKFYQELIHRNAHFVDPETQKNIRDMKVLVAGCGSGGGACIEPLARLGVTHFKIADNGDYELVNLNRQRAFVDSIGVNKATFQEQTLKRINPYIDVEAFTSGITDTNLKSLIQWADFVFDCVDVTTYDAIAMKIKLHQMAKDYKKPVISMLDIGYCQWAAGFDYRKDSVQPMDGRLERASKHRHPIKVLLEMFPLSVFPAHSLQLVIDVLRNPGMPASQLGCAADLLAAVVAPSIVRFAKTGELISGWNINLEYLAMPWRERLREWIKAPFRKAEIRKLLNDIKEQKNESPKHEESSSLAA